MGARADAVRETRAKIIEAAGKAVLTMDYGGVTLETIADSAGVSVQTILRHFESKDRLFHEAFDVFHHEIDHEMDGVKVGDIRAAIEALHARYEWMGDGNIRMLSQEETPGPIAEGMKVARKFHCEWVERIFDPYLPSKPPAARRKRLHQFLIACDVYTWKLIRRDQGASRAATTETVIELANAITRLGGEEQ
jgi:AcrR family transcriptional regulator